MLLLVPPLQLIGVERRPDPPLEPIGVELQILKLVRLLSGESEERLGVLWKFIAWIWMQRNQFVALKDAVLALEPTMTAYQQRHRSYKYQIALNVVFHKARGPHDSN